MVSNYFCQERDKYINRRFKTKHINSIAQLHMYYDIVTNKCNIGDVYWCDFEKTIQEHLLDNSSKFNAFSTTIKCEYIVKI